MDKATAQRLVRNTLKAPFDRKRYHGLINELCNGFDDGKAIDNMSVPEAFAAHVKSCQRLGTFTSPEGELADVLVVKLTESWKLERSRTALRDFVAHKLKRDNAYKEAGLIAFVAPDSESWRFSYIRMDYETKRDPDTGKIKTEERLTPARRYSYLVGADEECHTAQTRFLPLLQNTTAKPTLAQLEEAFSVESVTKEFFNEYARLFKATDEALTAVRADLAVRGVSTVDFAKKLLGQVVFLYFIQKKGWLGVGQGQSWGEGPRHFLRQLADQAVAKEQCLFNEVLEPLFYDTLATDRDTEAWCPRFQCRIPFLNGGLFEPLAGYDWEQRAISLPNALFTNQQPTPSGDIGTGILDVFDRYNFTVNEAEPLEKEVAIDPEMLGKVFENLIEENRRKGLGAFYTPREIVHYMCQESLINYLDTTVNAEIPPGPPLSKGGIKPLPRADIEALIREGEQAAHYETAR
ncbi:MAG: class I SAM-dependent DNA methyltransferase, partial [Candidatus Contendobacter sp.]|nr:class I SAM-dependent DNA methyltransferase [Candidatus Contendobacter sp.]